MAAGGARAADGKVADHRVSARDHAFYRATGGQWVAAFVQRLRELGWIEGRTVAIEVRWADGRSERFAEIAAEFVRLKVDVIVTAGPPVFAVKQATSVIPIVFATVADPLDSGLVASLARPGGNVTGFIGLEYGMSAKWLELLKEIAPRVTRVAVVRDSAQASGIGQPGSIQAVAPSFGVELRPVALSDAGEIERAISAFAREPNGGLIVVANTLAVVHRQLVVTLAAKHRLPAVYSGRDFVASGGLISYGPDRIDPSRRAASYVDRSSRVRSRPTCRCRRRPSTNCPSTSGPPLGLDIPPMLLARADEVIE